MPRTWCRKYSGRLTPSAYVVPTFGQSRLPRTNPHSAQPSLKADRSLLASISLIGRHNGVAKAKLLNMHNKKLIPPGPVERQWDLAQPSIVASQAASRIRPECGS